MTHTVIVTPETQRRESENIRNECKRHCRIGKVKHKLPKGWTPDPQPIFRPGWVDQHYSTPDNFLRAIAPERRNCSCPPGTLCNSVACPHLPVITCSTAH